MDPILVLHMHPVVDCQLTDLVLLVQLTVVLILARLEVDLSLLVVTELLALRLECLV